MRHVYSVVRFVPDPAKGECVNLGLVAGSEDSEEWILRTVSQHARARQVGGADVLPDVVRYLERLTTRLEAYSDAHAEGQRDFLPDQDALSEKWIANLAHQQRGVVQFTPPQPVDAESAESAVEMLWDQLITETSRRTFPFKKKHRAIAAVRDAIRAEEIADANVWRPARIEAGGSRAPIDFAVHNGRVAYLAQCWSFQLPDKERLLDEVQAWAWAIRALRTSGGSLSTGDIKNAEVPREVELAVVHVPPDTAEDKRVFEKAETAFHDRQVNALVVEYGKASEVAGKARAALMGVSA